jgi:hypothetical protein
MYSKKGNDEIMDVKTELWVDCPSCHKKSQMEVVFKDDHIEFHCEWEEYPILILNFADFLKLFEWNMQLGQLVQTKLLK